MKFQLGFHESLKPRRPVKGHYYYYYYWGLDLHMGSISGGMMAGNAFAVLIRVFGV